MSAVANLRVLLGLSRYNQLAAVAEREGTTVAEQLRLSVDATFGNTRAIGFEGGRLKKGGEREPLRNVGVSPLGFLLPEKKEQQGGSVGGRGVRGEGGEEGTEVPQRYRPQSRTRRGLESHPEEFEKFWARQVRKEGKGAAAISFDRAMRFASFEEILEGWERSRRHYAKEGREHRLHPLPATWLNQKRWMDEYPGESTPSHLRVATAEQRRAAEEKLTDLSLPAEVEVRYRDRLRAVHTTNELQAVMNDAELLASAERL